MVEADKRFVAFAHKKLLKHEKEEWDQALSYVFERDADGDVLALEEEHTTSVEFTRYYAIKLIFYPLDLTKALLFDTKRAYDSVIARQKEHKKVFNMLIAAKKRKTGYSNMKIFLYYLIGVK